MLHCCVSMLLPSQVVPPLQVLVRDLVPPLQVLLQLDQGVHEDQAAEDPPPDDNESINISVTNTSSLQLQICIFMIITIWNS